MSAFDTGEDLAPFRPLSGVRFPSICRLPSGCPTRPLRTTSRRPEDIAGRAESVGGAIKTMLSAAVFPADADDLARLPVGAFASVAGEGELSFRAQAALSSTTNLLATPGLPIIGSVALTQAASLTVGAEWMASGEFELRVSKPTATRVRLSFYRRRGRSLSVSAKALVGVSARGSRQGPAGGADDGDQRRIPRPIC